MEASRYRVVETDIGPLISESRVTVFDVLELAKKGRNRYEIGLTLNLTPMQVAVALDYIDDHREALEAELVEILARKAEREAYWRAVASEREEQIARLPLTPEREAVYARLEQIRVRRGNQQITDGNGLERP